MSMKIRHNIRLIIKISEKNQTNKVIKSNAFSIKMYSIQKAKLNFAIKLV